MEQFIKKEVGANNFELLIDTNLFTKEIVFKSAFIFLEKWYFFFKLDADNNIIMQFRLKEWVKENPETVIWDFSDELLNNTLREKVFEENKEVRTEIITSSLKNSLREAELPNNWKGYEYSGDSYFEEWWHTDNNEVVDFDKDIDDILKEIENDPELKVDEEEIDKILKEIEEEEKNENTWVSLDVDAVEKVKKDFNNK